MRERAPKEETIEKVVSFLKDLKTKAIAGDHVSLARLHDIHNVSKQTGTACIELAIIKKLSVHHYDWIDTDTPFRKMALKVLDTILHKHKKKVVTPLLPEFATIANTLNTISEQLAISINKNNNRLKGMKSSDTEANLFRYEEQRHRDMVYLTGKLLPAFIERDRDPFSNCGYFGTLAHKATEAASIILDTIESRRNKDA